MLQLFDKYFLILVLIQGFVVGFLDNRFFRAEKNERMARKASLVGKAVMALAVILFISAKLS